ncbi:hypothetical protein Hanom_Chr11g00990051 [Helianthus anomalus]
MRNIWIGNYRLFINIARFAKENDAGGIYREPKGNRKGHKLNVQENSHYLFKEPEVFRRSSSVNKGTSYADMVSGKSKDASRAKEVTVSEIAKAFVELHNKAIIGRMKDL